MVFLFGLGGLGFNALQIIKHIGARVIVSDLRQERLDEAAKLGIPRSDLVPVGTSVQEFVKENGLENKIDTVLDFVGTRQTFEDAQHIGTWPFIMSSYSGKRKTSEHRLTKTQFVWPGKWSASVR